jgi:hypothetical protein
MSQDFIEAAKFGEGNTEEFVALIANANETDLLINLQMTILKVILHKSYNGFTNYALKDPENTR